jgi:putative Holliday junction resolvase
MRRGVRLAVDVGDARIGLAASDPYGVIATPVETVPAGKAALRRIVGHVLEREAVEVYVGLPRSLSGKEGVAAAKARDFAKKLALEIAPVRVALIDERLTTVTAHQNLRASGVKGRKQRSVVDQAAAIVILQNALETERASGRPPGRPVKVPSTPDIQPGEGRPAPTAAKPKAPAQQATADEGATGAAPAPRAESGHEHE